MPEQSSQEPNVPPRTSDFGDDLRTLGVGDAEALGELFVEIWRETYDGLMSPSRLATLSVETATRRFREMFEDSSYPAIRGLFRNGQLVGWARGGKPRDDDPPHDVELWSLNVARAARGSGAARILLDDVLHDAPAYLWVVDGNERALRFYEREGFVLDGTRRAEPADGTHELRMVRGERDN